MFLATAYAPVRTILGKWMETVKNCITRACGFPQGCPFSPVAFSTFSPAVTANGIDWKYFFRIYMDDSTFITLIDDESQVAKSVTTWWTEILGRMEATSQQIFDALKSNWPPIVPWNSKPRPIDRTRMAIVTGVPIDETASLSPILGYMKT